MGLSHGIYNGYCVSQRDLCSVWSLLFRGVFIKLANLQTAQVCLKKQGVFQKIIQNELCGCCITFKLCKVRKRAMKPWQQVITGAAVLTQKDCMPERRLREVKLAPV